MSEVVFSMATHDDDAALRRLLASSPMPGHIRLRLEREPDYFAGCGTMGSFTQVLVARDAERVVGLSCRAVRTLYVNGQPEDVGYLGHLRVQREYQGRSLVVRGFRHLHELHADRRVRGYLTTIVDGNREAEGVLVRRRRGPMPRYRFLDRLITLAFATPSRLFRGARRVREEQRADVEAFLEREGPRRNFFPVLRDTPGLTARDFVLVTRNGRMAGAAGLWDQSSVKQTVIDGYDGLLSAARPVYNCAARIIGRPPLPRPGAALRVAYGSFFCAIDRQVVRELLEEVLLLAAERGHEMVLVGFTESDPSLEAARQLRHIEYRSSIYSVTWDDGEHFHDRLDSRPRYLELATL
ncbi:MAG TPA: hypothetical protein VLV78_23170 [Thermoanaerobaculia bacterium]|nr:hypothetical protein [Thermoanaerobaculia bacterium]